MKISLKYGEEKPARIASGESATANRICFVITSLARGGAETQMVLLATALKRRGWSPIIATLLPENSFKSQLADAGIPVHWLGARRGVPDLRSLARLIRLLRLSHPHIVHSFMVHANLIARLSRLGYWVHVQISSARSDNEGALWRYGFYRLTDSLCDLTTQVSTSGLNRYLRIGAIPARKGAFIPNGVDVSAFRPDARLRAETRLSLGLADQFVWLAVGRCDIPKDYPCLIRAFGELRASRQAVLLIAGSGPLLDDLKRQTGVIGLGARIRFLGQRSDVVGLLNAADAYVLSSQWEGMPNALLEAAACGLPAVATSVGGVEDLIREGVTGAMVPPGDHSELARAMSTIMALDDRVLAEMGTAARQHVCQRFSISAIADQWEQIYSRMLSRTPLGPAGLPAGHRSCPVAAQGKV